MMVYYGGYNWINDAPLSTGRAGRGALFFRK
jgi:hypothetical protein